jgi:hypothetical protein
MQFFTVCPRYSRMIATLRQCARCRCSLVFVLIE